jgi:hypothetical protein
MCDVNGPIKGGKFNGSSGLFSNCGIAKKTTSRVFIIKSLNLKNIVYYTNT